MDQGTKPIQQDIEALRGSMSDKIEAIESKVKGTVDQAVTTAKRTVDLNAQVGDHPWAALGAAVLAGYALGSLGGGDSSSDERHRPQGYSSQGYGYQGYSHYPAYQAGQSSQPGSSQYRAADLRPSDWQGASTAANAYGASSSGGAMDSIKSKGASFLDDMMDQFGDEIETIKTAAVSAITMMLRDAIKQNLPRFEGEYQRVQGEQGRTGQRSTAPASGTYRPSGSTSVYSPGGTGSGSTGSTVGSTAGGASEDPNQYAEYNVTGRPQSSAPGAQGGTSNERTQ